MGCRECCKCCCSCLSRIPYGTTVGLFIAIFGMLMFVGGFVAALKYINKLITIKGSLDFGHTVAGIVIGIGIILGILILLFACCTSGASRRNIYSGFKSKFAGKCFSSLLMLIEYVLYLAWALLSVAMAVPVLLQIILNAVCNLTPKCIDLKALGLDPLLKLAGNQTVSSKICSNDLIIFCQNVKSSGTPLIISLVGAFVAALGTVHVLMCLSANYAYVNSYKKLAKTDEGKEEIGM